MRGIKVTFADGNTITTSINGSEKSIRDYYLNNVFNFGDTEQCPRDNLQRGVKVEFIDGKGEAYNFPNGFRNEASSMYGWLRHYNLTPEWGTATEGESIILLTDSDLSCLRLMQQGNPARFGNPPETPPKGE